MICNPTCEIPTLSISRGADTFAEVLCKSGDVPTDCTGWTVEASVLVQEVPVMEIAIAFTDAPTGKAQLHVTVDQGLELNRLAEAILEIVWTDVAGFKKSIHAYIQVCN